MKHIAYIIAGPTASGKSDFAHALARRVGGTVINCDSVQIYKGIENISASPLATPDLDGVPYKLFSILPLSEQISVAEYLELARTEFDAAMRAGMPPIFVGGTGFYINALLNGISPIPEVSKENRLLAREMVKNKHELSNLAADPQRAARALEVFLETGRHLSEWQSLPRQGAVAPDALKILINPPKEILADRIAKRIPEMMSGGLPAGALAKVGAMVEARAIISNGWPSTRAIGASELVRFINGEIDEQTCYENWRTRTNQYAKRQRTWFRTQFAPDIEIDHVPTEKDLI
ncbi:MAG: tRNA (adenosine(37)-N6)-dimethylallyltransferase MiaA [Alphaproteobacteria bacterium]|nr:tRNA (adenosine(37)-N6)-dimethylallyltransferase MiaA [Alphaproteobacteria bacterium]